MEVITIESKAYQEFMQNLNRLIQSLSEKQKDEKKDEWLDSNAACRELNISNRTLHRLKKERLISYSMLRGRYRYKRSDIEQIMRDGLVVSNPETLDELRQTFHKI